ncbi:hypothetical protein SESBI_39205 [Sesbania bispinosa]|nr:hypothetical protein SESBI_39205 [Sesbania bispinosa]
MGTICLDFPSREGKGRIHNNLIGDAKELEKKVPDHSKWKLMSNLVMSCSWLLNSMTAETRENFIYYRTAAEIWSAAKKTYSNIDNTYAISEIKTQKSSP